VRACSVKGELLLALIHSLQRHAPFASLENRHFRWFWLGRLASSAAIQMGSVAQGWLAYELTGSALALGGVSATHGVARLVLSLYAGALADRFEKRTLLLLTRALMVLNAVALAVLMLTGVVHVWHLVAYSFLSGIISSFMMPAQQAVLPEIVGRRSLMNALSLTSLGSSLVGIVAASAAGYAIAWVGVGSVYIIVAGLCVGVLFSIAHLPLSGKINDSRGSLWVDLRDGARHARVSPLIPSLLAIAAVRVVLGYSSGTLMPVYAKDVLQLDARGLGILTAAPIVGSLISSLALAFLGNSQRKGRILMVNGLLIGVALIAFANLRPFPLILLFLGLLGAARNASMLTNNTLVQVSCDAEFRGRTMAIYMMVMALLPVGTISAGAMADAMGMPFAITVQGGLMVAIYLALWLTGSKVKDLP